MEKKPFSDKRWWDNPMPISSDCSSCQYTKGFGKCDKYPEGIPKEMRDQSFPGTENYNRHYCNYRKKGN